jgi:hypothetical protein
MHVNSSDSMIISSRHSPFSMYCVVVVVIDLTKGGRGLSSVGGNFDAEPPLPYFDGRDVQTRHICHTQYRKYRI